MKPHEVEKYPFVAQSNLLKAIWENSQFAFDCFKASKVIAKIIKKNPSFEELLSITGTIRKLLDPSILKSKDFNTSSNELFSSL
ncbi:hypothetical protein [Legionella fairfieldensis]|uniref:hypothetical protein n=1 Tax=Legionella fairfieldensis TaxID=45064 RepID=UPI0010416BC3|nr:hypothetical protein [Legionella fairfieldensis]